MTPWTAARMPGTSAAGSVEPAMPGHPDPQRERQLPLPLRRPRGVRHPAVLHPGDPLRPVGELAGHRTHPSLAGGDGEM